MSRKKTRKREDEDNGFAEWGGYMEAKKAKLAQQFNSVTVKLSDKKTDVFKGVAIMVNGYTNPSADELKLLMAENGGLYHLYQNQCGVTTHIIATNLPNVKINQMGNTPVVKPEWLVDSIEANKLLDYSKYLLYTNQSRTQPKLNFQVIAKPKLVETTVDNQENKDIRTELIGNSVLKMNLNDTNLNKENSIITETDNVSNALATPTKVLEKTTYAKTATDPKFLSEFYNNSRLHLISTLGAEFKQLVNEFREKSTGIFPGLQRLKHLPVNENSQPDITSNISETETVIMHIDMDCFFVSVGLRDRPELIGKPVAVTHSKSGKNNRQVDIQAEIDLRLKRMPEAAKAKVHNLDSNSSMAEIASCSYEARKCGIKNGMLMGSAIKLCPNLIPIPYNFEGYKEVSATLYKTIAEYTLDIEAVSCDEMYVDVSKILKEANITVDDFASHLRMEITERTGCPCSTGFGSNRLQARLATKRAKPNGQYYLRPEDVEDYMQGISLSEIPGVGYSMFGKLKNMGLETCADLQSVSLSFLKTELGAKNSELIYDHARGIDKKPLNFEHERKSVSADVNYGIRFKTTDEALTFLESLSQEVFTRLTDIKMKSKCLTLKLLIRAPDAPKETAKYLGCGVCDATSRSVTTGYYLDNTSLIYKEAKNLFLKLKVIPEDLRGVGIQLSRLEKTATVKNSALTKFLTSKDTVSNQNIVVKQKDEQLQSTVNKNEVKHNQIEQKQVETVTKRSVKFKKTKSGNKLVPNPTNNIGNYFKTQKIDTNPKLSNKTKCNIDLEVLEQLPEDLRLEVMKEYGVQIFDVPKPKEVPKHTENKSTQKRKKSFADLSEENLKALLRNWITTEIEPKEVDVNMLGDYLKDLALNRRIEELFPLVRFIHRHVSMTTCKWHEAYFKLIERLQEGMMEVYKNPLMVPKCFNCVKHS